MTKKTRMLSASSFVLSMVVLVFCYMNFDGQISEPYRGVNSLSFYGILGGPVAVAIGALVLGIMAWFSIQLVIMLSDDSNESKSNV